MKKDDDRTALLRKLVWDAYMEVVRDVSIDLDGERLTNAATVVEALAFGLSNPSEKFVDLARAARKVAARNPIMLRSGFPVEPSLRQRVDLLRETAEMIRRMELAGERWIEEVYSFFSLHAGAFGQQSQFDDSNPGASISAACTRMERAAERARNRAGADEFNLLLAVLIGYGVPAQRAKDWTKTARPGVAPRSGRILKRSPTGA